jgi:hypothetical protein
MKSRHVCVWDELLSSWFHRLYAAFSYIFHDSTCLDTRLMVDLDTMFQQVGVGTQSESVVFSS